MKRRAVMCILILVCTLLQCTVFQIFAIASIRPNILLILTVSFGLMRGKKSGLWVGFFCGAARDLFFESTLGMQALLYLWIGYGAGCFYRIFYDDDIKTPLLLVSLADLAYGTAVYILQFLIRGRVHFFYYLRRIMIPEMLYTIFLTFPLYRIFYRIEHSLEKSDKRSLNGFV